MTKRLKALKQFPHGKKLAALGGAAVVLAILYASGVPLPEALAKTLELLDALGLTADPALVP